MFPKKILLLLLLVVNYLPNQGLSQSYPVYKNTSAIAILDQDALFAKSDWGKKVLEEIEVKVTKLAAQNRLIENELEMEEFGLTEKRKVISKIEFDILAIEFDSKVKQIRKDQAEKQYKINIYLKENRKLFFEKITPILLEYIDELGVEVLLNKDTVALASLGSDITTSAINRINERLEN